MSTPMPAFTHKVGPLLPKVAKAAEKLRSWHANLEKGSVSVSDFGPIHLNADRKHKHYTTQPSKYVSSPAWLT